MGKEERPADGKYYEAYRTELLSQGDIFKGTPAGPQAYAKQLTQLEDGTIHLLSGPVQTGFAMLTTPTCAMSSQGPDAGYDHDIRSLVPLLSIAALLAQGKLNNDQLREARKYDGLINYMYLPAHPAGPLPESLAALFLPIPLSHRLLMETTTRVTQLAMDGAQQLQRKLAWYDSGFQVDRRFLKPPMD
jgi:hypothetical protein